MIRKILILLVLLCSLTSVYGALISNGSFESSLNTATDWEIHDINCTGSGLDWNSIDRNTHYSPSGSYGFSAVMQGEGDGAVNALCDFNISHAQTISADQNLCFSIQTQGVNSDTRTEINVEVGDTNILTVKNGVTSPNDLDGLYPSGQQICGITGSAGTIEIWGSLRVIPTAPNTPFFYLDAFTVATKPTLIIANNTPSTADSDKDFNILIDVRNSTTNAVVPDATVNLNFNLEGVVAMTYDSVSELYYTQLNKPHATYSYDINATKTDWIDDNLSSSIIIERPVDEFLLFTPLTNIDSWRFGSIFVTPSDLDADLTWRVDSNSASSEAVEFIVLNSLDDGKQYKILTATPFNFANSVWNFNDTLTFGTNNFDSIQRVWNDVNETYHHSFTDTLLAGETKYYKLDIYDPIIAHNSVTDSTNWDSLFTPNTTDFNGTNVDIFASSFYTDINSTLISPKLSTISSNLSLTNYVFQMTGKVDATGNGTFSMGTIDELSNSTFTGDTFDFNTSFQTVTVADVSSGYLNFRSNSTSTKEFTLHNYALTTRGFFSKSLKVLDDDGGSLSMFLDSGSPIHFIREGQDFIVDTEYYDPDGNINYIEVSAYIDKVDDANRIKKWTFDSDGASDNPIIFRETIGGLVDLIPSAPNRDVLLTVKLIDENASYYEIQSEIIKLVQFPYFPGDLSIFATVTNKQVGKHPKGTIRIDTLLPDTLRGVKLYIYDANESINDANTLEMYKDIDFTCLGMVCNFDYLFEDWLFKDQQPKKLTISMLLTTEDENTSSSLTAKTLYFNVFFKEFETARILETVERTGASDHNYRHDEEIQLVLQVRDSDYANIRDEIEVSITPETCDAQTGGNCTSLGIQYSPLTFLFDKSTGYNYFFFKEVIIDGRNNSALGDGNYLKVQGSINDKLSRHTLELSPLLARKCDGGNYDTDCSDGNCFFPNMLIMNHYFLGCPVFTPPVVTTATNPGSEGRLGIDTSKVLTAPTLECVACLNTDLNNAYSNNLEQELTCASWYTFNEAPLDKFDFYITNPYSDLSKTGDDAQYIKFSVPYPLIMANDVLLMRQAMDKEFGTGPDTIGELLFDGFNHVFGQFLNPLLEVPEGVFADGLLTNYGFDCNYDKGFSPTNISGLIFFKTKGLKVLNKQDLLQTNPEVKSISGEDLIEYLNYEDIPYPKYETDVEVYLKDFIVIDVKEVPSPLVIDAEYSDNSSSRQTVDGNQAFYSSIPERLKFEVIGDLFYNGERNVIRRAVSFWISEIINPNISLFGAVFGFVGSLFAITSPDSQVGVGNALVSNWFLIIVLGVVILFFALVYSRIKRPTG